MTSIGIPQSGEDGAAKPYDQFILFGDSITQRACNQEEGFSWQAALQEAYSRKLDVVNRGLAGYTTADAIKILHKFFPSAETVNVRFMTIFFGANDACVPGHDQHIPLNQYKENLKQIIKYPGTKDQNPRMILLTPPPVNEYQLQSFDTSKETPHPSRTAAYTKLYATAAREVGSELGIPVADLWTAFMKTTGWQVGQPLIGSQDAPNNAKLETLFTDGLHLTADGYRIVYDVVMQAIVGNWPDQDPEVLPMVFPSWVDAPK